MPRMEEARRMKVASFYAPERGKIGSQVLNERQDNARLSKRIMRKPGLVSYCEQEVLTI